MLKIKNALNNTSLRLCVRSQAAAKKVRDKLREKNGSFFTDQGLVIVITIALAGLIIAFLFTYFKDRVFVGVENKTDDFFNFTA